MSGIATPRRRIALVGDAGRVDLALPLDDTLDDALRTAGHPELDGNLVVIGPGGHQVDRATPCDDLVDGGLYAVVDITATAGVGVVPERRSQHVPRRDHGAHWWLLGVVALLVVASGFGVSLQPWRLLGGIGLTIGALICAVIWARRDAQRGRDAVVGVAAPVALAFVGGMMIVPLALDSMLHLAVVSGLLAAAVTTTVVAVTALPSPIRAASATAATLLVLLAVLWGTTLMMQWGVQAAAAVSAGIVPLALRALPSTLVNVPEGYFIDYRHFMSSRWTVRGAVPESPGEVREDSIRRIVADSSARLLLGTGLLSLIAAVCLPVAVLGDWQDDPFVVAGGIALMTCLALALLLTPRHTTSRTLRWMPRAAAAVVVLCAGIRLSAMLGSDALVLGAGLLFVCALIAVAITVPVSRGARSLGLSRFGDFIEWLSVALALPAALLFADVLDQVRGMMSG